MPIPFASGDVLLASELNQLALKTDIPFVSVKSFGAVGDGVTDDRAAFVSCITASPNKTIKVPNGTYYLSAPNITTTNVSWDIDPGAKFIGTGKLITNKGFWTDIGNSANINRFSDRVFVGSAASESHGNQVPGSPAAGTFLTTQMGAFWIERAATTLSVSPYGEFGGVFAARTSDKALSGYYGSATIGVVGIVENDDASANPTYAWASYMEANRGTNNKVVYGSEIAVKNKGNNVSPTPYNRNGWGAVGIWMPAGGDSLYNGVNANPCSVAIMIGRGDDHGNTALPMSWNKGIIFNSTSLTGTDGDTGDGVAIEMAKNHAIRWQTPTDTFGAGIVSRVTDTTKSTTLIFTNDQFQFLVNNQFAAALIGKGTGVDNQVRIFSSIAGSPPQVQAGGADTNIDLSLIPKGTGLVRFGTRIGTGDVAINGYLQIKDNAGNVVKLATVA